MMWWKKHKWKVVVPVLIAAVLAAAFYGAPASKDQNWDVPPTVSSAPAAPDSGQTPDKPAVLEESSAQADEIFSESREPEDIKDAPETGPAPEESPLPAQTRDDAASSSSYTCTISINCATILENLELCDPDKVELVPENGWILEPVSVPFYEGESVFSVLERVCRQQKIHMEYEDTPLFNSAYIEGIYNLYEFDVGELSGWMYAVNGQFPNYGCSRYQLQDGDVVCWVYTCDLGRDVGGGAAAGGQSGE